MTKKRLRLPEGLERDIIVPRAKDTKLLRHEFEQILEEDFSTNHQSYQQVELDGLLVFVKVKTKIK